MVGLWGWYQIWLPAFGLVVRIEPLTLERLSYGQGASVALPIWALYMKACYEDTTLKRF